MKPRLSILIPTLVSRSDYLDRLLRILADQWRPDVEVLTELDDGEQSIGAKRNTLVANATGDFLVFADDDDLLSPRYSDAIVEATATDPDCIGFLATRWNDGSLVGKQVMSREFDCYSEIPFAGKPNYWVFQRPIMHICPVRAELVRQVPFPEINVGEDGRYAAALRPLLKSEVFVDEYLYHYELRSDRTGERVNEKRKVINIGR